MKKDVVQNNNKPLHKKWWVWVLGLIVFAGLVDDNSSDVTVESEPETVEEVTAEATTDVNKEEVQEEKDGEVSVEEKISGIGEEVNIEDVYITVNDVSTTQNIGGEFGINANSQFLILNITVRNEQNEEILVDDSFFQLLSGERTYDADTSAGVYANDNDDFWYTNINPGVSATRNVVFDIPENLEDIKLQVQINTGLFSTASGLIEIK